MNLRFLGLFILSGSVSGGVLAAETTPTSTDLRENYVEGLKVIAEVRTAVGRADEVLALVEAGADEQANRISQMEGQLVYTAISLAT